MVSRSTPLLCALLLMGLLPGCASFSSSTVRLSIDAKPQGSGSYALQGEAKLPDRSKVIVQGVRQLVPRRSAGEPAPHYAILGRTLAEVEQGKWKATLSVLQPGGATAQETWQQPAAGLVGQMDPAGEVQFMVLTQPRYNSDGLEEQLQAVKADRTIGQIYYTDDGRWYLQQQVNLAVTLPNGATAATVSDRDALWGPRNSTPANQPTPTSVKPSEAKTNQVPLTRDERVH
jgi:hypothetical protein